MEHIATGETDVLSSIESLQFDDVTFPPPPAGGAENEGHSVAAIAGPAVLADLNSGGSADSGTSGTVGPATTDPAPDLVPAPPGTEVPQPLGTLPAGKTLTIVFDAVINLLPPLQTQISNQGFVSWDTGSVLTDDPATEAPGNATITLVPQVDLEISKIDTADPVPPGGSFSYQVTVTNNGPSTAKDVVITDTLPAGVTWVSDDGPNVAPMAGNLLLFQIGDLANGTTVVWTINVTANPGAAGTIQSNTAVVSTSTNDVDGENDAVGEDTTFAGIVPLPGDLYVSVGGGGASVGNPAAGSIFIADQITSAGTLLFDPINPDGAPGLAFDNTGRLFASDGAGFVDNELYEIDPDTGMLLATIGTIRNASDVRVFVTDLAFQPGTNVLYGRSAGLNPVGFDQTLVTIDPVTAIATPVGPANTFITNGGLAFAPDGTLFASDTSNGDGFHVVDPLTGQIQSTVPLTGATDGVDGLGVRDDGGGAFTIFGTAERNTDLIVTIDPVTAVTTALSPGITGFGNPADLDFRPGAAAPGTSKFDFVKDAAVTAPGFTTVLNTDAYNPINGFGWLSTAALEKFDTKIGSADDLRRDYHFFRVGSRTFRVDLPDGEYDVTLNLGSSLHRFKKIGVIIDGVQVDQVTTAPGEFVDPVYTVTTTGGKLELTIERQAGTFVGIDGLTIAPVIHPPVVTAAPMALTYEDGDPATPIDAGLTVIDTDSPDLTGATVRITAGHVPSEDVLEFTDQLGITGSFVSATGVLTLSGTTSVANYQTALRSVAYRNSSATPTFQVRTIEFEVSDGINAGSDTRDVDVIPMVFPGFDFDFVKSAAATAPGFTPILTTTAYNATSGFGWESPMAIESFDTGPGNPDELFRDYHFFRVGSRTFRADVPNGDYDVTYTMGSTFHGFKKTGVSINGTQVDAVATIPGDFYTQTYFTSVTNGRIEVTIERQAGSFVSINALEIAPVPPRPPASVPSALASLDTVFGFSDEDDELSLFDLI